jgi:chromosome segregation ATPase
MSEKDKDYFPELSKIKEAGHSLVTAMNMASQSLVDYAKERDRLLAEIEQLKKERAELQAEMERYEEGAGDDYNIYDLFKNECDKLWQLITRLCLNANPPIRVREHTLKSLKEAGVHCKLKVEGRTSKLELWRGDELVGVVINTKPERVEIGIG